MLLLSLALLAIAGTVLTTAARRRLRRAMDAVDAERRLQLRWASRTLRAAVLPVAEELLEKAAVDLERPVAHTFRTIRLGGLGFTVVVCDEQAKANVNRIAQLRGERAVGGALSAVQSGLVRPAHVVPRADPTLDTSKAVGLPQRYSSYDQLFELSHPSELFEPRSLRPGPAGRVTCWGDGRIGFRRAHPVALREALRGALDDTDIAKVLDFRAEQPDGSLGELLRHLALPGPKARAAAELMTDGSDCHGLWIVAEGPARRWYRFYVYDSGLSGEGPRRWVFQW